MSPLFPAGDAEKLTKSCEYQKVYTYGKALTGRIIRAYVLPTATGVVRAGISISRRTLPKATDRNRIRRIIKEWQRQNLKAQARRGYDVVVVLKKPIAGTGPGSKAIRGELAHILSPIIAQKPTAKPTK